MALDDDATLVIGAGNFFTAPVDTVPPADYTAPEVAWVNIGHTSLEDIFSTTSEGGEKTTLATLQNSSLRTKYSKRVETFNIVVQQFDAETLKLYYGSNASTLAGGEIGVPEDPVATQKAFLAVFIDGDNHFGLYVPKADILRGDDFEVADTESLNGLQLAITALKSGANDYTYAVTPMGA